MKLLNRLRDYNPHTFSPDHWQDNNFDSFYGFEEEALGVGAATEQDLTGLDFIDFQRKREILTGDELNGEIRTIHCMYDESDHPLQYDEHEPI